jgi:hypothetical protein
MTAPKPSKYRSQGVDIIQALNEREGTGAVARGSSLRIKARHVRKVLMRVLSKGISTVAVSAYTICRKIGTMGERR